MCRDKIHKYTKEYQNQRQLYGFLLTLKCEGMGRKQDWIDLVGL